MAPISPAGLARPVLAAFECARAGALKSYRKLAISVAYGRFRPREIVSKPILSGVWSCGNRADAQLAGRREAL
jgi:hypothetical protein